jgi:hypothetical protein
MTAIKTAERAATAEFDAYLTANRSTATPYVPPCVIAAATAAYRAAGGAGEIVVVGRGNRTHPVCSVSVRRKTQKDVSY